MQASVRRMGNSAGIILPKPLLAELGIKTGDAVSLTLEKGRRILTPARRHPRAGWAEASKAIAAAGDDALVWPEFGNAGDDKLTW
ncbi:MAG: AbrB/MazE/SpoVT family DNA-binding domain-containing protein [Proteobacteria bacterium]|nr:AbrB/MazE/SpoVT family DNA-binding domain-containing protein [Pseudomonadota bacterium]